MLLFNLLGIFVVYAIQRLQQHLPLDPDGMGPVPDHLRFPETAARKPRKPSSRGRLIT